MMSRRMIKVYVAVIGLAVLIGLTARTVSGKEQKAEVPTIEVYESMESEYLSEVKAVLAQNHYSNCGVNMTKVIDADESRIYTVEIYHNRLCREDAARQQELISQLEELNGMGQYSLVEYKIAM